MNPKTTSREGGSPMQSDTRRQGIRLYHVAGWLLVALGLFVASAAVGAGGSVADAQANEDGVLFGSFAAPTGNQSQIEAYQELESQLGSKLGVIRTFSQWEDNLDNQLNNWVIDGDRQLFLSVKPLRRNGTHIPWRSIANAQPGSQIHNEMVELARDARNLGPGVWITFHHEPEARDRVSFGEDDDFIAAWRAFHRVFEQQGVDAEWVWTMTSWSFEVDTADRRSAGKWYPGDAYVDFLGADPYNWNQCRNERETWRELESIITPFIEFGNQHPDKQLILPEWGSAEGGAGAKAGWLDRAADFLQRPDIADRFAAAVYFHTEHEGTPRCNWWLDSSSSSLNAARRIAQDPNFQHNNGGGQVQIARQQPANIGAFCTVRSTNQGDLVEWTDRGDGWGYNVRRNDRWVGETAGHQLRNNNVHNGTYEVISRHMGQRIDSTCARI